MSLKPSCVFTVSLLSLLMSTVFSRSLLPFMSPDKLDGFISSKKMDKFIKHLGIPDIGLCHPDTDENMEPMFNEDLPFGDLLMDEESQETEDKEGDDINNVENDITSGTSSSSQTQKSRSKPKKWPNGVISYYISNGFTSEEIQKIENAIEEMNSMLSSVYFRPYENSDKNYVIIFNGKGCYSQLGMRGGHQPLSLQSDKCLKKGTIQHELLHVLGFSHEQNRPDRDYYIKIMYDNIPKKWYKNYKRFSPAETIYLGKYDYYSVLHYPPQAPKSNGEKLAFTVLDDNVDIQMVGMRREMTKLDFKKAEELYSDEV